MHKPLASLTRGHRDRIQIIIFIVSIYKQFLSYGLNSSFSSYLLMPFNNQLFMKEPLSNWFIAEMHVLQIEPKSYECFLEPREESNTATGPFPNILSIFALLFLL